MRKMKLSLQNISLLLFLVYAMFSDLYDAILGSYLRLLLWGLSLALLLCSQLSTKRLGIKKNTLFIASMVLFFLFYNNAGLRNGTYMIVVKFLFFTIYAFFLCRSKMMYDVGVGYIVIFGMIHVFATYFFYFVPSLYRIMYFIWGEWPPGTGLGKYGYRAALSDNYSGNGIIIAITYLAVFSFIMCYRGKQFERKKRFYIGLFLLAFYSVILTTKRAHLLFGLVAMIVVYYFCNPKEIHSKGFKFVVIGIISIPIIYWISLRIPALGEALLRFQDLDEDSHMINRYKMWKIALDMFSKKPILGNGWSSYRYALFGSYLGDRYGYMNAHNVYIQLLAEVGIAGFLLYMSILIYLIWNAFKILRTCNKYSITDHQLLVPLYFSAAFLVFYSLYSMTGNCFYDKVQPFYFLVGGIIMGCKIKMRLRNIVCLESDQVK